MDLLVYDTSFKIEHQTQGDAINVLLSERLLSRILWYNTYKSPLDYTKNNKAGSTRSTGLAGPSRHIWKLRLLSGNIEGDADR